MFKNFRKSLVTTFASLAIAVIPVVAPVAVSAASVTNVASISDSLKSGSNLDPTGNNTDISQGSSGLTNFVTKLVDVFSVIVGLVSVIMIIYGGFRYVTSGGDSGNVSAAKNTIIYAVIGLVVVVLAQVIVKFVLDKTSTLAQ